MGLFCLGYSHLGPSHCEAVPATNYRPLRISFSQASSNLSGWNTGIEKRYLRYFGLISAASMVELARLISSSVYEEDRGLGDSGPTQMYCLEQ